MAFCLSPLNLYYGAGLAAAADTLVAPSVFVILGVILGRNGITGVIGCKPRFVKLLCGFICVGIGITGAGLFAGQFGIGTTLARGLRIGDCCCGTCGRSTACPETDTANIRNTTRATVVLMAHLLAGIILPVPQHGNVNRIFVFVATGFSQSAFASVFVPLLLSEVVAFAPPGRQRRAHSAI